MTYHKPVMLSEVLSFLITDQNSAYLDCTLGGGGHSKAILENISPKGGLIALDRDLDAIRENTVLRDQYSNFKMYNIPFANIYKVDEVMFGQQFSGILLDLGVSSHQLDEGERGFSFRYDSSLDMRMDQTMEKTAYDLVNNYSHAELTKIFREYGEEKYSFKIASKIVRVRSEGVVKTTFQLRDIIASVVPQKNQTKSFSRIFQALRIELNGELTQLSEFLEKSIALLKQGGRLVIISYHSLEDRIVKKFIKEESLDCICPPNLPKCICNKIQRVKAITKKPVLASKEENIINPRARSAKMRVCQKL